MTTETLIEETVELDVETKQQIAVFGQAVAKLEGEAKTIDVTDDVTEEGALIFINGMKQTFDDIEAFRDQKVGKLTKYVNRVNGGLRPYKEVLTRLISATDALRSQYLTRKKAAIEEENRRRIAEAERARQEKERQEREAREAAEKARLEAERIEQEQQEREYQEALAALESANKRKAEEAAAEAARKAGDEAAAREAERRAAQAKADEAERVRKAEEERQAAEAEKARLEKKAVTLEARADIAATAKTMIAPTIEVNTSTAARTIANGARVGTRDADEPYFTNGMPVYADPIKKKYETYRRNDPRLPKDIDDSLWIFDTARAIRILRDDQPVPGMALRQKFTTTASRKRG